MSTTQDRLRQAARFTRLDADRELLTEAADALDRREAVIRLLEGEVAATTQPAEVTDEQIISIKKATRADDPSKRWGDSLAFARAILALRPVQVPLTDDVARDAERWRTFLATRPSNTHEGIIAAIDAASQAQKGGE